MELANKVGMALFCQPEKKHKYYKRLSICTVIIVNTVNILVAVCEKELNHARFTSTLAEVVNSILRILIQLTGTIDRLYITELKSIHSIQPKDNFILSSLSLFFDEASLSYMTCSGAQVVQQ